MGQPPTKEDPHTIPVSTDDGFDDSKKDEDVSDPHGDKDYALVSTNDEEKVASVLNKTGPDDEEEPKQLKKGDQAGALHRAADKGHAATVQFLLESKAQVNSLNPEGWTPLHCAVFNNHKDVVKILIKFKANIEYTYPTNFSTPLHYASGFSDLQMVQLLVNCKADINARDLHNDLPLDYAKRSCLQPIIDYLATNPVPVPSRSLPGTPVTSPRSFPTRDISDIKEPVGSFKGRPGSPFGSPRSPTREMASTAFPPARPVVSTVSSPKSFPSSTPTSPHPSQKSVPQSTENPASPS